MKTNKNRFFVSLVLLTAFILWTTAICFVDVQPIGPRGSSVGFAQLNRFVHDLTGTNFTLYNITDWLGLVPVGVCLGFAVLGLIQWIGRKRFLKVDFSILVLGGFYLVVLAAYLFFEYFVINDRPVLIEGYLEASYPSSTTILVICVMSTAVMQLRARIKNKKLQTTVTLIIAAFTAFMVIGRLLSGVHWFSDIVGAIFLSAGLAAMYDAIIKKHHTKHER